MTKALLNIRFLNSLCDVMHARAALILGVNTRFYRRMLDAENNETISFFVRDSCIIPKTERLCSALVVFEERRTEKSRRGDQEHISTFNHRHESKVKF